MSQSRPPSGFRCTARTEARGNSYGRQCTYDTYKNEKFCFRHLETKQ